MPNLAQLNMSRCRDCGKLFKSEPRKLLCAGCSSGEQQPVARALPPSPEILPEPQEQDTRHCVRCEARPHVEGSDFCLPCNIELFNALGDAANTLFPRLEVMGPPPSRRENASSMLRDKRNRTSTARVSVAPPRMK